MINFSGRNVALWKIIIDLGFTCNKSESNRKVLIQKWDDVRAAMLAYLKNILLLLLLLLLLFPVASTSWSICHS
jgi:hypothetical protein